MISQLKTDLEQNIETIELLPSITPDKVSINQNPLDINHTATKSNTYAITFELMLDMLVYIVFSGRAITWEDIQENVADKHKRTLIRQLRALKELGYLENGGISKNRIQTFFATEKSKQLFGFKQGVEKR